MLKWMHSIFDWIVPRLLTCRAKFWLETQPVEFSSYLWNLLGAICSERKLCIVMNASAHTRDARKVSQISSAIHIFLQRFWLTCPVQSVVFELCGSGLSLYLVRIRKVTFGWLRLSPYLCQDRQVTFGSWRQSMLSLFATRTVRHNNFCVRFQRIDSNWPSKWNVKRWNMKMKNL